MNRYAPHSGLVLGDLMIWMAIVVAAQGPAEPPKITIEKTESGYRAEAEDFDLLREAYVSIEVERQAFALCGDKQVDWGKFGSIAKVEKDPAKGPPRVSGFFKEFSCVDAKEQVVASIPFDWKAGPADEADVRRIFETYYSRRDAGDFEGSSAMFEATTRPEKSTLNGLREFNRKLGAGRRRITNVTWYVNPASAPRLGAYAALDFVGEYTGVHFYCGYIVLYRLGPGKYEIVREEQNTFERNNEKVDPAQIGQMKAAACRE